ncbi:MAG TPA: MarR family transcriptional regulator [Trueperaceae bacterium]|nr:MarR family transcriptional regulator [Trueperaceae bacterium]
MKETVASADYLDLARLVLRLSRHLTRTFDEALVPAYGIATKDYLVLRMVQAGEVHPGGVAERLNMPPASVSRALERLESRGYISRAVDSADHRRFRLAVTAEGVQAVESVRRLMREALGKRYAQVPATVLRSTIDQLASLNEVLETG